MGETSKPKRPEDYEYKVKIGDADPEAGSATLVFEEVSGADSFAVSLPVAELKLMVDDGRFGKWAEQRVSERIQQLAADMRRMEEAAKTLKAIEDIGRKLAGVKVKARGGGK